MTTEFIWQLPTSGDGRYGDARISFRGERSSSAHPYSPGVTDPRGDSFNYFDHLHQVARAADLAGFDGIRIPDHADGDEPWIVAGYVARGTRHLKLITEFSASRGSAVYAAKNAVSYQRYTGGRFAWQISTGGDSRQRRALGDYAGDDQIAPRIEEFVTVARGVITNEQYSYKGEYFEVLNGGFRGALSGQPVPPVYLSGNTPETYAISARVADVHVFDALPLETLRQEVTAFDAQAVKHGRVIRLGIRLDIIARETEQEAIADARRYRDQTRDERSGSAPHVDGLLWHGLTTHNTGATATLVGSYEQVAEALSAYAAAGVTSFLLSAVPHFEEAYRIGEHVLPRVRSRLTSAQRRAA
ncbi:MAG TPA: LLM class flavin-dependent oxidoreductase [Methylophilaceae bacterium]|jgi:alkanesulfonate monooxygenase